MQILFALLALPCLLFSLVPLVMFRVFHTGVVALLGLGICLLLCALLWNQPLLVSHPRWRRGILWGWTGVLAVCLALSLPMYIAAYHSSPPQDATLVVLGSKVNGDAPSLMLQYRLDVAYDYLMAHPGTHAVLSGGQGPDEDYPEAWVMKNYLVNRGIAADRLHQEEMSRNTQENLSLSAQVLQEEGLPLPIAIVSDGFHQLRAGRYAALAGFEESCALSSSTPWGLLPSYWIRELFGVVQAYLLK